ncbi:MAG: F0F1 ATP synthase subunit A [Myxococcota bacterium]|nr:F0F1 ATP synthase subunit A [Myxococcota bacterium]
MSIFQSLESATSVPWVIWSSLFAAGLLLLTGMVVRSRLASANGGLIPDEGFTVRNVLEMLIEMLSNLAEQNMGPNWRKYFPFIATLFFFILISNMVGMVPGIDGATSDSNTTWAWAAISFILHQYVGIKEHGWSYINHFLGPSLYDLKIGDKTYHLRLIAPLYAPIELISHLSRVFTLAVRLLANMFADHTVVAVWLGLVPVAVPALFMGLGLLVAFLQAYVFAMLSMIYIGLALEEAH